MIMNIKQRKIQIEPKTKLNYNRYIERKENYKPKNQWAAYKDL